MTSSASPRTILHIGADKTGTTTVQEALAHHREELARAGIWYPDLDGRPDHWRLAQPDPPILAPPPGTRTVLLSSEALWSLSDRAISHLLTRLPGGPVSVVAYVREPADHAEAAFLQRCRMCRSEAELRLVLALRRLPPSVNPIVHRAVRRLRQLVTWVERVDLDDVDDVLVRTYGPATGAVDDIVADFCTTTGLAAAVPALAPTGRAAVRRNPTPDLVTIHASVLVRARHGPAAQQDFLRQWVDAGGIGRPGPCTPVAVRSEIRRRARPLLEALDRQAGGLGPLLEPAAALEPPTAAPLDRRAARSLAAQFPPATETT